MSFYLKSAPALVLSCLLSCAAQMVCVQSSHAQTPPPAAPSAPTAQSYALGSLKLEAPWTRATPGGASVAGGFITIVNAGKTPDRLVSAKSDIAGRTEIHEMSVIDGIMKMQELPKGLEIAPGQTLELKPGSFHIMFMELKKPIILGDIVTASLVFEKGGQIEVQFPAKAMGTPSYKH